MIISDIFCINSKITSNGEEFAFRIVLSDGVYRAIAVRAVDYAGNISSTKCLVNEKDNGIPACFGWFLNALFFPLAYFLYL